MLASVLLITLIEVKLQLPSALMAYMFVLYTSKPCLVPSTSFHMIARQGAYQHRDLPLASIGKEQNLS